MSSSLQTGDSPRDVLPGGLVLRRATPKDREALVSLLTDAHRGPDGTPATSVGQWQQDLFDREHPTVGFDDMTVVEDQHTGMPVACLMVIPQTWSYGGVPLGVSAIELAATHPDYRRLGLMSRQLEALLAVSAGRGDLVQALVDILYFRSVDFHPALVARAGRGGKAHTLPPAPAEGEPVSLRPATVDDVPALIHADSQLRRRVLMSCLRNEAEWRHELTGRSPGAMMHNEVVMVEAGTRPAGYVVLGYGGIPSFPIPSWLPGLPCPEPAISVSGFELLPEVPWCEAVPSVLRQLTARGTSGTGGGGAEEYMLWLGAEHPAYDVLGDVLVRRPPSMGWFLRVPDVAALLRRIAPVLEQRLVNTPAESFTGDLRLHFYQHGLHMRFEAGRLTAVRPWAGHNRRGSDASLPEQMFLQMVFGHARWEQLAPAFPDCRLQTGTAHLLLPVLFPPQNSHIFPLV
ncbi:GNAT family N-acetyltransferase [Sphaerisporangium sp. NPDC051017]|uniref:GNAT family N-acetyltransferase n=1 Tax=Sphaerisporangium sp. NPDC051017 TaxID=3154636 RepID=UPI0034188EC1